MLMRLEFSRANWSFPGKIPEHVLNNFIITIGGTIDRKIQFDIIKF